MPHSTSAAAAPGRPCDWYGPAGTCGATPARHYRAGWRCAMHTPAAVAGRPTRRRPVLPARPVLVQQCPPRQPATAGSPAPLPAIQLRALAGLALALELAALGWHVFPLSPASKRPLANCPACRGTGPPTGSKTAPACRPGDGSRCPRRYHRSGLAGRLVVRRAAAVPGVATGPSGLVLIDIDTHDDELPPDLATGLLPGIDLAAEPIPCQLWADPARFRDGRDSLRLLAAFAAALRPGPPVTRHRPVTVATPSGGRHLWYQAPAPGLRQALSDPQAATAWPGRST